MISTLGAKPMSGLSKQPNVRTTAYKGMLSRLPPRIRGLAKEAYKLFLDNPDHPSLAHHPLSDSRKGKHRASSRAISITKRYRAIYVRDEKTNTNVWYWIGSHEDYNNLVG